MNIATQLLGERLAKQVSNKSRAREVLSQRQRRLGRWQYGVWIALGAAWGFFIPQDAHMAIGLVGATAGMAFFAGLATFNECLSLRRRLEAVIVLLQPELNDMDTDASNHAFTGDRN